MNGFCIEKNEETSSRLVTNTRVHFRHFAYGYTCLINMGCGKSSMVCGNSSSLYFPLPKGPPKFSFDTTRGEGE